MTPYFTRSCKGNFAGGLYLYQEFNDNNLILEWFISPLTHNLASISTVNTEWFMLFHKEILLVKTQKFQLRDCFLMNFSFR